MHRRSSGLQLIPVVVIDLAGLFRQNCRQSILQSSEGPRVGPVRASAKNHWRNIFAEKSSTFRYSGNQ